MYWIRKRITRDSRQEVNGSCMGSETQDFSMHVRRQGDVNKQCFS